MNCVVVNVISMEGNTSTAVCLAKIETMAGATAHQTIRPQNMGRSAQMPVMIEDTDFTGVTQRLAGTIVHQHTEWVCWDSRVSLLLGRNYGVR